MRELTYYRGFRFFMHVPGEDEVIHAVSVYHDIFAGGTWIEKGHAHEEPTLRESLINGREVDVYLCSNLDRRGRGPMRRVRISYDPLEMEWFPLDLDAESSDVARERVLLEGAIYSFVEDIEPEDVPQILAALKG